MKASLSVSALGLGAVASAIDFHGPPGVSHGPPQIFTLVATGPSSAHGPIGQISDGQNRIGGGLPGGKYYLKDGKVWDQHRRGCILTPPTTQWQCDEGAIPTTGFDINCDGKLTHDHSPVFYACPVNDDGVWNVYSQPAPGQKKCVAISLLAHEEGPVRANCPHNSSPAGPPTPNHAANAPAATHSTPAPLVSVHSAPAPAPTGPAKTAKCPFSGKHDSPKCPLDLDGPYEFPHLIVPVDQFTPDTPLGNGYNGTVAPGVCTTFNFDIHSKHAGKQCALVFMLPEHDKLKTSAYSLEGSGNLYFSFLDEPVTSDTTWNNKPKGTPIDLAPTPLKAGQKIHIGQAPCPAGRKIGAQMCSDEDLTLNYFQDFNPEPIGLYVRVC